MRGYLAIAAVFLMLVAPLQATAIFDGQATEDEAPSLEDVTIVRDEYGVPHIYTDDEQALWYANGYVQAQDRLWAMDLLRHIGYANASSVVGPGGGILAMDLQNTRDLYDQEELEAMYAEAPARFQEAVEAYTDGVNRAAAEMHATGEMPAEFGALDHAFHPWKPMDTVATAVYLLAVFGNGGGDELSNAELLTNLQEAFGTSQGVDAFEDMVWGKRGDAYATIPETPDSGSTGDDGNGPYDDPRVAQLKTWSEIPEEQKEATLAAAQSQSFGLEYESALPDPVSTQQGHFAGEEIEFKWGSNALLIAPELSESGKAMMAGGPQMGYFNPQVPYEVGLHLEGTSFEAEGMGVTGAPGVIIGRAENFAWTVTSGASDQTDIIELPADGPRSYTWDGESRELDCTDEKHLLYTPPATGGPAADVITQEVCDSHLGPIVAVTGDKESPDTFWAQRTSARNLDLLSAVSWLALPQADNLEEFRETFTDDPETAGWDGFAFTFNFHFAGVNAAGEETICYHHVGMQPDRHNDLDPRLPTPAGSSWQWEGFITGDEMPWACDPDQGYYAQWNNLPARGWSPGDSRELWGSIHRVERLDKAFNDALAADDDGQLSLDQAKAVLKEAATHDSLVLGDNQGPDMVDMILANDPGTSPGAMEALADWEAADFPWDNTVEVDGTTHYADPGHTVYDALMNELMVEVFEDELGDAVRNPNMDPRDSGDPHAGDHGQHNNPFTLLFDTFKGETDQAWCDDVTTDATETCADQVADALANAGLDGLTTASEVPLTEEHKSPFTSLGLGPAFEMPMTNRATFYHFHVGSDTTQSFATLPPGSTGHYNTAEAALLLGAGINKEHNEDQLELYVNFEHKQLPWTTTEAQEDADSTELLPVPTGFTISGLS